MKKCNKCFVDKPESDFYFQKNKWNGSLSFACKTCTCGLRKEYRTLHPEAIKKRRKEYRANNGEAIAKRDSILYRNNKDRYKHNAKRHQLKTDYGITIEQFEQMRKDQSEMCAICGNPFEIKNGKNKFGVDHCHKTGVIRGLLCMHCNSALGQVRDSIKTLEKMIAYLRRYNHE